ncbi:MAG: hypothetical protein ABIK65_14275 [Candidatus Eisenbacteria bacterium]
MIMRTFPRGALMVSIVLAACAPPAMFLQPVKPSMSGVVAMEYLGLPESEVEAIFVRPYTGRTLLETSGTTSAMLYDLAYLEKRAGAKAGANEALYAMNRRYVEEGISFKIVVWGEKAADVDLALWRFRLRTDDGRTFDPMRLEPIGVPEFDKQSLVDRKATWRNMADITFPLSLAPPLSLVVLEIEKNGERVQHHTWKFDWK